MKLRSSESAREANAEQIRKEPEVLFRRFLQADAEAARDDSSQLLRDAVGPDDNPPEAQLPASRKQELHRQDRPDLRDERRANEDARRRDVMRKTRTERGLALPLDEIAPPLLNAMPAADEVAADYRTTGLSLKFHPLELVRSTLTGMGVTTAKTLANTPASTRLQVAGLVLVRQCPATAKGTTFMTLEDETGTANLIVWPRVWERYRRVAGQAVALIAHGHVERSGSVIHVCVRRLEDLSERLRGLASQSRDFR